MEAPPSTVDGHHRPTHQRTRIDLCGRVDIFDMVDIDLFTVVALNMMVLKLGYTGEAKPMFYNYLRPLTSLDVGLYALACEENVRCLATIVKSFKLSEVIDDVMRQLSFDETELDGKAGFADVAGSDVDSSGLSHDESFGVDDLDLNLNKSRLALKNPLWQRSALKNQLRQSMDLPFDNIGNTNLVLNDVLEGEDVDVINADGFDSDPGNDEGRNYKKRSPKEAKEKVYMHSIEIRSNLKLYKNDSVKMRARCEEKVHVFTMSQGTRPTGPYSRTEAGPSGSSGRTTRRKKEEYKEIKHYTYKFLSEKIYEQVRVNPDIPVKAVQDHLQRQALVAVGLDSNNGTYPLAYALVEAETKSSCPTTTRIMESIKNEAHLIKVQWNGANKYQVSGRPTKEERKRYKHKDEPFVKDGKLSRKGRTIACRSCGNIGHNKATCGNNAEGSGSASRQVQQTEPTVGQDGSGGSGAGAIIGLSVAAGEGGVGDPGGAGVASQVSQTRNGDEREMGDGVPTQSSAAGGASEWSFL
nr:hypothetical protein [Tanacetum cinerariifolium]